VEVIALQSIVVQSIVMPFIVVQSIVMQLFVLPFMVVQVETCARHVARRERQGYVRQRRGA
jgi:hypothetical protein